MREWPSDNVSVTVSKFNAYFLHIPCLIDVQCVFFVIVHPCIQGAGLEEIFD